jgi:hypothetical protein
MELMAYAALQAARYQPAPSSYEQEIVAARAAAASKAPVARRGLLQRLGF